MKNKKAKIVFSCVLVMLQIHGVAAQDAYTLEQCVEAALKNNLQIQSAQNGQKQTTMKIRETSSGLYPQVSGEVSYQYFIDVPVQVIPASAFGGPEGQFTAAQFGLPQVIAAKAEVSQQVINPQLFIGLKAARVGNELSALQVRKTKEDIVYNVSATYFNLLTLYKSQDLLRYNMASLDTTIVSTRLLYENDLAKKSDVSRLEISRKTLQKQLLDTEVSEKQLLNLMKIFLGLPHEQSLAIDTSIHSEKVLLRPQTNDTSSIERRTDLQLLQVQQKLEVLNRKSIQAAYIPTLAAFASYTSTAYNTEFNPTQRLNNTSYPTTLVGLTLSIPIFDGGRKAAQVRSSRLESENLALQGRLQKQQILSDRDNALEKYNVNLSSLALQEEALAQANTTYSEVQLQYREGTASVTDLLNAGNELRQTQTGYLTALVNLRIAGLELRKAVGTLLEN